MSFQLKDPDLKPKFEHYLNELLSLFDNAKPQPTLTGRNIVEFSHDCYVLHNFIKSGNDVTSEELRQFIKATLFEMKRQNVTDVGLFFRILDSTYHKTRQEEHFTFDTVHSVNLDIGKMPNRNFTVNHADVRLVDYQQLQDDIDLTSRIHEIGRFRPTEIDQLQKFSYAVISAKTTNEKLAYQRGHEVFELFRGILNFADRLGTFTFQFGRPQTLSQIPPAKLAVVFDERKEMKGYWITEGPFEYRHLSLESAKLDFASELFGKMNALRDGSMKNRLISAITKHSEGLDGNVTGTSFITFWQVLEIIALGDYYNLSEKEVSSRIGSIFHDQKMRDLMDVLRDRRNYLVHKGAIWEFDLEEINLLRSCCEPAILFLFNNIANFEDEPSLDLFYTTVNKSTVDLERQKKILDYVIGGRGH